MRKLIKTFLIISLCTLMTAQICWIMHRVNRSYNEHKMSFVEPSSCEIYAKYEYEKVTLYRNNEPILSLAMIDESRIAEMSAEDNDSDGLSLLTELRFLTCDSDSDSDGDGVSDANDASPNVNSNVVTVDSLVATEILKTHVQLMGYDEKKVFAQQEMLHGGCYSASEANVKIVCATEMEILLLRYLGIDGSFDLEKIIYIPGFVSVLFSWHQCGPRCGDGRYFVIWDIPLIGPRTIWSFGHYLS